MKRDTTETQAGDVHETEKQQQITEQHPHKNKNTDLQIVSLNLMS